MYKKTFLRIIGVILALWFITLTGTIAVCFSLGYKLESTRRQLDAVGLELTAAKDQQRQLGDIVRGTDEILRESFTTVAGIRSQIQVIRESYEKMEKLLFSGGSTNCSDNNNSDSTVENQEIK